MFSNVLPEEEPMNEMVFIVQDLDNSSKNFLLENWDWTNAGSYSSSGCRMLVCGSGAATLGMLARICDKLWGIEMPVPKALAYNILKYNQNN